MAGFDNDVIFAENVDFSGTSPVSGQINQDGELLVGSSVAPYIRSYVPAGSSGVSITTGQGTIDFSLANVPNSALQNSSISINGGTGISVSGSPVSLGDSVTISASGALGQTITGDSGGALSPTAGNWNLSGSGSITTSGSGSTLTTQLTGLTNHALLVGAGTTTITKVGPSATSGQVLQSAGASADPAFSTATYPSTATGTGKILRADGTNWVATTATFPDTAGSSGNVLTSDGTNWSSSPASGGGITWTEVTGTSQAAAVNNGYIANNAGLVTITLPANFVVGSVVRVGGLGAGLWSLVANTGDIINFGSSPTSAGGSLTATNRYDAVEVLGVATNSTWTVLSSVGNLTVA